MRNKKYILKFSEISIRDIPKVGGKNAALGEMFQKLKSLGIKVPDGFAITAPAFLYFLDFSGISEKIASILRKLHPRNLHDLKTRGSAIRQLIKTAALPPDLALQIKEAYRNLGKIYGENLDVAVRSSATAEDLPDASFAGQQETFLNVKGETAVLGAVKRCMASLFTDRAISYRHDKRFSQTGVALSVAIQKMVRSDLGASGVMFTLDPETGFDKIIVINGAFGLGETVVLGQVIPDEFLIFKPNVGTRNVIPIIGKKLGRKNIKLVYGRNKGTMRKPVSRKDQRRFCLSSKEVLKLAFWGILIEKHFSKVAKSPRPMDIEWAKDGKTGKLYIVQARPETVHSTADRATYTTYRLHEHHGKPLVSGIAVGSKIGVGRANIIRHPAEIGKFRPKDILVTEITDPDWEPVMKMAAGIVTDKGGRTSHAAIVSRELGIPCIVGAKHATKILRTGEVITVDCSGGQTGCVYPGEQKFTVKTHQLDRIPRTRTRIMVNIGSPDDALANHYLPVSGVGLGRLEFIIASTIQAHPNALLDYARIKNDKLKKTINKLTLAYPQRSKTHYYVQELAFGIAKIAAAFWPHEVIIRFSDFKTNEYQKLLGGQSYEPLEENPMLGWRGASRYYDPKFTRAFALECDAIKNVRETMGLSNVTPMIPFCRTPDEGKKVVKLMKKNGLDRKSDSNLKIYVMCEIPSNVLQAEEFLKIFDGMSIGSNDLTQLALGLDRDSGLLGHIANENNPTVKKMIQDVIAVCRRKNKYIGICGQAPSDYPNFVKFLIKQKIDSISLNPDSVIKTILTVKKYERES